MLLIAGWNIRHFIHIFSRRACIAYLTSYRTEHYILHAPALFLSRLTTLWQAVGYDLVFEVEVIDPEDEQRDMCKEE